MAAEAARDALTMHPDLAAAAAAAADAVVRRKRAVVLQRVALAVAQAAWDADEELDWADLRGEDEWAGPGLGPGEGPHGWQDPAAAAPRDAEDQPVVMRALVWQGHMTGVVQLPRRPVALGTAGAVRLGWSLAHFAARTTWQPAGPGAATSLAEWVLWWAEETPALGPGDDAPIAQQLAWWTALAQWAGRVVSWWAQQECGALVPSRLTHVRCRHPALFGEEPQAGWDAVMLTPGGRAPRRWVHVGPRWVRRT